MVSVLPPHIAFEMKNEMIRKTRKAQMKSLLACEENFNQTEKKRVKIKLKTWINFEFKTYLGIIVGNSLKRISIRKSLADFIRKVSNPSNQTGQSELARHASEKSLGNNSVNKKTMLPLTNRPKPSTFHDLHIKSHNNVR